MFCFHRMEFVFFYNIFLFLLLSFSAYDCWQKPSTWKVCMLITVICLLPKGRFTLYKLLACAMFTVNRQPESYRVNQTLCDCKPECRCKFSLYDTIRVFYTGIYFVYRTHMTWNKRTKTKPIFPWTENKEVFCYTSSVSKKIYHHFHEKTL